MPARALVGRRHRFEAVRRWRNPGRKARHQEPLMAEKAAPRRGRGHRLDRGISADEQRGRRCRPDRRLLNRARCPLSPFAVVDAYDQDVVYAGVAERHAGAAGIVRPRAERYGGDRCARRDQRLPVHLRRRVAWPGRTPPATTVDPEWAGVVVIALPILHHDGRAGKQYGGSRGDIR
jgi:hypothetical protein